MKILLTGGSGMLGEELRRLDPSIFAPSHAELDVCDVNSVWRGVSSFRPDVVIHAAAVTDNRKIEKAPELGIQHNIVGTANVAFVCRALGCRLVYLSTDYVYRGDRGNYRETDGLYPFNLYAWTKLGGECSVRCCVNYLIIRTTFARTFDYTYAFDNKWFSKDYVDILAPEILAAATGTLIGVVNIGTERKTVYELTARRFPEVAPTPVEKSVFITPIDTSLNTDRWRRYQDRSSDDLYVDSCRVCGGKNLERYLDLGVMPLVNSLAHTKEAAFEAERYPLQVLFCGRCGLSQLSLVVGPKKLFTQYLYRSSISKTFATHCLCLVHSTASRLRLKPSDLVVEIASNDGVLLEAFRRHHFRNAIGVEPAKNLAQMTTQRGFTTVNDFWNDATADAIVSQSGRAALIVATNVFAHVHDVHGFLSACKRCLAPGGRIVLEVPYLPSLIKGNQFDTIYHEHLSYFMMTPLWRLAKMHDLRVTHVEPQPIHGGSVRVELGLAGECDDHPAVQELVDAEEMQGYRSFYMYRDWAYSADRIARETSLKLYELKRQHRRILGFGASAKGCILLNAMRAFTSTIDCIVDDTPEKIGLFSPGTAIPIVDRRVLAEAPPDHLLILAWNIKDEIIQNTREHWGAASPSYIIPIPSFEIVHS